MKTFNKENLKFVEECKVYSKSIESDLREKYSPYFNSYMELTDFEEDEDTEKLSGYSGFLIDIPNDKRSEYTESLKKSIDTLNPKIKELKMYPFFKVIPQSNAVVSYVFAFQKNPGDFNKMNEESMEEKNMLDNPTPRELYDREKAIENEDGKNKGRHY